MSAESSRPESRISLDLEGISIEHAEWAWRREIAKELALEPLNTPHIFPDTGNWCQAVYPCFEPVLRTGVAVGTEKLRGFTHYVLNLARGVTRQEVLSAVEKWLEGVPIPVADKSDAVAAREPESVDYVARLRDLAAFRCKRSGFDTAGKAENHIMEALSPMLQDAETLSRYVRPVAKHFHDQAESAAAFIARERRVQVMHAIAFRDQEEDAESFEIQVWGRAQFEEFAVQQSLLGTGWSDRDMQDEILAADARWKDEQFQRDLGAEFSPDQK